MSQTVNKCDCCKTCKKTCKQLNNCTIIRCPMYEPIQNAKLGTKEQRGLV